MKPKMLVIDHQQGFAPLPEWEQRLNKETDRLWKLHHKYLRAACRAGKSRRKVFANRANKYKTLARQACRSPRRTELFKATLNSLQQMAKFFSLDLTTDKHLSPIWPQHVMLMDSTGSMGSFKAKGMLPEAEEYYTPFPPEIADLQITKPVPTEGESPVDFLDRLKLDGYKVDFMGLPPISDQKFNYFE